MRAIMIEMEWWIKQVWTDYELSDHRILSDELDLKFIRDHTEDGRIAA